MAQKMLTKAIEKKLPALFATDGTPVENKILVVKFFAPWGKHTWYGVEYDPLEKRFFGYVEGDYSEWGYFSLTELENVRGKWGMKIERDQYWTPVKFSEKS